MRIIKLILKVFLWPVSLVLLLAQIITKITKGTLTVILSLLSTFLLIISLLIIIMESVKFGIALLIISWLVSPYGLILIMDMFVDSLADGVYRIREKLC